VGPDQQRSFYEKQFLHHLDQCADWRTSHEFERFLLHARKALEASLHLAHLHVFNKVESKLIDDMTKALVGRKVMPTKTASQCDVIRTHSNGAAHVLDPADPVSARDVDEVAGALKPIVGWVKQYLDADATVRSERLLEEIDQKARIPPDERDRRLRTFVARLADTKPEVAAELRRAQLSLAGEPLPGAARRRALPLLAVGLAGVALGWAGASLLPPLGGGRSAATVRAGESAPPGPGVARTGPVAAESSPMGGTAPAATVRVAAAAAPLTGAAAPCPPDMVHVDGATVSLSQPTGGREAWPRATRSKLPSVEVSSFCIHERPVRRDAVDAWLAEVNKPALPRCGRERGTNAAVCIDDETAAEYCRARRGELPSIAEWELVVRNGVVRLEPGLYEWASDKFPPAVFARTTSARRDARWDHRMVHGGRVADPPAGNHLALSWNAANIAALARPDLGLRCVVRP
jgi:formylglycine-generating enzyme required for sulfatase activity